MRKYIGDKKFYYHCNRTNKEGTACELCLNGFTLNENGLCIDKVSCKEEVDGKCIKCFCFKHKK